MEICVIIISKHVTKMYFWWRSSNEFLVLVNMWQRCIFGGEMFCYNNHIKHIFDKIKNG